jgi:hypothetical protein
MFCGKCGAKCEEVALFCGECGNGLTPHHDQTATLKRKSGAKKVVLIVCLVLAALIAFVLLLNGVGGDGLSGRYENNVEDYFVFKDGNKVSVRNYGFTFNGTYELNGDELKITISVFGDKISTTYKISENRREITDGYTTYKK